MARDLAHCNESYDLTGTETALMGGVWPKQAQQNNYVFSSCDGKIRNITMKAIMRQCLSSRSCSTELLLITTYTLYVGN